VGAVATASRRRSPTRTRDLLLVALTFSSGAIDAISFIALGKVFTAFMTGNFVFLGLGIGGAGGPNAVRVVIAIAAFAGGVMGATRIVEGSVGSGVWSGRVSAALGAAALSEAVFLAVWAASGGHPSTGSMDALAALAALAMGLQSGAVLSLGVRGVFTTAATATLMFFMRDAAAASRAAAAEQMRLGDVLLGLLAGAAAGGLLLVHARSYAPVLPLAATAAVIAAAATAFRSGRAP
jgi:uncharacterized membrane protein YoaK (UPF0700 family)